MKDRCHVKYCTPEFPTSPAIFSLRWYHPAHDHGTTLTGNSIFACVLVFLHPLSCPDVTAGNPMSSMWRLRWRSSVCITGPPPCSGAPLHPHSSCEWLVSATENERRPFRGDVGMYSYYNEQLQTQLFRGSSCHPSVQTCNPWIRRVDEASAVWWLVLCVWEGERVKLLLQKLRSLISAAWQVAFHLQPIATFIYFSNSKVCFEWLVFNSFWESSFPHLHSSGKWLASHIFLHSNSCYS